MVGILSWEQQDQTIAFNILNPDTFKPPIRIRRPISEPYRMSKGRGRQGGAKGYLPAQSWSLRGSGDCPSCMSCRPSLKTCSI